MINYKEARVNNWIMYNNRLFQIEAISRSLPCLNTDEFGIGVVDWNNLQPIVLSPEILEKCGAIVYEFDNGLGNQYRIKDRLFVIRDGNIVDYGSSVIIKHLHQLQNLYFALTGEELNYTP